MTLRDNQYVAIISHGSAADAMVQQLCVVEPALRWVRSATQALPEQSTEWLAQLQPQGQLGTVLYVVEQACAEVVALLAQQKHAMRDAALPVLTVLLEPAQQTDAQMVAELRALCDGVLVLREPSSPDDMQPLSQLLQLDAALRTALNMDTHINLYVEDIVACMAGVHSHIQIKSNDVGVHAWLSQWADQCKAASEPVHSWGVFTEVSRSKPLTTARAFKQTLEHALPETVSSHLCTWYPDVSSKSLRSFVIASYA